MTEVKFEGESISPEQLIRPVGYRLLVGPVQIDEKSKGGILLTHTNKKELEYVRCTAKVLAKGSEAYNDPKFQGGLPLEQRNPTHWVDVGDIVVIGQYAGQPVKQKDADGNEYTMKFINDDEIFGVVPNVDSLAM